MLRAVWRQPEAFEFYCTRRIMREEITYTQMLRTEPHCPPFHSFVPVNEVPSPKLFQSLIITPSADWPFVLHLYDVGETRFCDIVLHKFLYHQ